MLERSPEFIQAVSTLAEANDFLLGALAQASLKNAILEAENARNSIFSKEQLKEGFTRSSAVYAQQIYKVYCSIWQKERGGYLGKFFFGSLPSREQIVKRKKQLVIRKVIAPLRTIYSRIEGREPDLRHPWLGKLLIKAAFARETTEAVYSHLSRFGLDPETLVEEVYQALDREPGEMSMEKDYQKGLEERKRDSLDARGRSEQRAIPDSKSPAAKSEKLG